MHSVLRIEAIYNEAASHEALLNLANLIEIRLNQPILVLQQIYIFFFACDE